MIKKFDSSLLYKIEKMENHNNEVIIYSNNLQKLIKLLKENNEHNYKIFDFINAVGVNLTFNKLKIIASYNFVEYITSVSKVFTSMEKARKTINIEKLHEKNILGQGKNLAIIDTGISPHLDFLSFSNRVVFFKDFINEKTKFYDDNGHGTFVSGVALGNGFTKGNKYIGIAPKANLIMLKALDSEGEATAFSILSSMEWIYNNAKEYNIGVVCMSFGSTPLDNKDPLVMGAEALVSKNICVVAAAGNSGPDPRTIKSPGVSNRIITVGGIDDRETENCFKVPDFSSRGPAFSIFKPDILAPAVDITSTNFKDIDKLPYTQMSGTSVATPIVAGTVVLLRQIFPNLNVNEIKKILLNNTIELPYKIGGNRNKQGYGFLHIK